VPTVAAGEPGDFNGDDHVDLADHALFRGCLAGPDERPAGATCEQADLHADGDVDLADFSTFQAQFGFQRCDPVWSALAGSSLLNGSVYALAVHDDGPGAALYAGGSFTSTGGVTARRIARWDGSTWTPLGGGMNGWVLAMTVFDDGDGPALFVGGAFTMAGNTEAEYIAKWDGANWSPVGGSMNNWVYSFAVHDDGLGGGPALYVGGSFTSAGGTPANRIARWNGSAWSALGNGVSGGGGEAPSTVYAMAVYDDGGGPGLYAGGRFTAAGMFAANRIAKWDGSAWSPLSLGMYTVYTLTVFDDGSGDGPMLCAGGAFETAGGLAANHAAQWNGSIWSPLGGGTDDWVTALAVYDDGAGPALYAGGRFSAADDQLASHIARWDGVRWSALETGTNDGVSALAVYDDGTGPALFVGGSFTTAGAENAAYITRWSRPPPPCPEGP
jgi:hypothetical protein